MSDNHDSTSPTILTPSEFAERINKSVRTLRVWDKQNLFPARRSPGGSPYYLEQDVTAYFEGSLPKSTHKHAQKQGEKA